MGFIAVHDIAQASHQIMDKLVGTYIYTCPLHDHAFELREGADRCLRFPQDDLVRGAYGRTVIEKRYPALDHTTSPPEVYSEISITTTIHLHPRHDEPRTITEILLIRLAGNKDRFTLWRPLKHLAGSMRSAASLTSDDCEQLGGLFVRPEYVRGTGADQRQNLHLELRRSDKETANAEDYTQPWTQFKICLYLGPGAAANIAGKQAGFEIRRSESYWTSFANGEYDWVAGRVELFSPADEATKAKWLGGTENGDTADAVAGGLPQQPMG